MKHIISTLAADTRYTGWVNSGGLNVVDHSVLVKGGAGVALMGGGQIITTPQGARTEVSDEDAAWLAQHSHFKDHMKGGFVKIENRAVDPDKAAQQMADDDGGKPKTPTDVAAAQKKADPDISPVQAVTNKGK